ncbi:MAG: extracellular solute-binding protein [Massiliimalia sp.]
MKNKKVMAKVLAALVISTSILTSCGGDSSKETSTANTGNGGTTASPGTNTIGDNLKYDLDAPINDGEKIEIDFWIQNELQEPYEKWIEEYTKVHPNVTVKTTYSANADHFQKLPIALQSGTGPDIFHMHNAQTAAIIPNTEPYPEDVLLLMY